jgi:hypothetical protein
VGKGRWKKISQGFELLMEFSVYPCDLGLSRFDLVCPGRLLLRGGPAPCLDGHPLKAASLSRNRAKSGLLDSVVSMAMLALKIQCTRAGRDSEDGRCFSASKAPDDPGVPLTGLTSEPADPSTAFLRRTARWACDNRHPEPPPNADTSRPVCDCNREDARSPYRRESTRRQCFCDLAGDNATMSTTPPGNVASVHPVVPDRAELPVSSAAGSSNR